ncbi:hypothetical protein PHYBOEH_001278 [Phytophthora boehmeriae]|uniref:Uncharacterized protein n=1 Tax=Phytophthora boehmeriae TaxID=109152 RepID=A0A8T1WWD6_9STRA|nr:hypothetical protein PHYBOEH_001278 [Phytophthora boehmeriae]
MTPRTPRRLPANRKGRRSIEHRKFKSPHEMSPGEPVVSCRAEGLKSKETPYTWQDTDDAVPPVTDDEISANHKAAVNEETAATSSSSDGETTAMLQQAHQMQKEKDTLKTIQEELELEPRRSGRKRILSQTGEPDSRQIHCMISPRTMNICMQALRFVKKINISKHTLSS